MKKIGYLILNFLCALLISQVIIPQFFLYGHIPSESMYPTLQVNDKVICSHIFWSNVKRNDIVAFEPNASEDLDFEYMIKRVIGVEGDRVQIRAGEMKVNGELVETVMPVSLVHDGSYVVPKDKVLLLGDNSENSLDARFWNNPYVDKEQIKYKLEVRVYPFRDFKIF
ncbi:MAG: signal peptidase I [Peptostreptococcaceae bacterium]